MKRDDKPASSGFVWVAAGASTIYVLLHASMLYRSLIQLGGLFSALVFGR